MTMYSGSSAIVESLSIKSVGARASVVPLILYSFMDKFNRQKKHWALSCYALAFTECGT